jgi:hypothetical protein
MSDIDLPSVVAGEPNPIDPATGNVWTPYLDSQAYERLCAGMGLPIAAQTIAHQRATGVGPKWKYFGQKPVVAYHDAVAYLRGDALRAQSPLAGIERRPRDQAKQATRIPSAKPVDDAA